MHMVSGPKNCVTPLHTLMPFDLTNVDARSACSSWPSCFNTGHKYQTAEHGTRINEV